MMAVDLGRMLPSDVGFKGGQEVFYLAQENDQLVLLPQQVPGSQPV